ncbi:hypothetical protein DFJ73DRAFT_835254 [Zopfochytrium polystomum]|nr:hypothetical protein DFJ73DRAFT_835254 [Zopfochytrium polystomum]
MGAVGVVGGVVGGVAVLLLLRRWLWRRCDDGGRSRACDAAGAVGDRGGGGRRRVRCQQGLKARVDAVAAGVTGRRRR